MFERKVDIKRLLWDLKNKFGDKLKIVTCSIGTNVEVYVKKYSLEFNIEYNEFVPYHKNWNNYSIEPAFLYNKPYSPRWFFANNKRFVDYCDAFVYFGKIESTSNIKIINNIKKINKIVKNIN